MNTWERFSNWLRSSELIAGVALAVIVGVIAGLGAVAFRWLIKEFQLLFFEGGASVLSALGDYYVILIPAAGGLLVGLLVHFGAREAKGHGVPEVMEAVAIRGGRIRPRVAVVKSLASSICIGSGGSVGREGPIVQIGASFGSAVGQWFRLPEDWVRTLVLCGAAGGISATFNSPIGGALFALEVIQRRVVVRNLAPVVISSVVADIVALRFLGEHPSFTIAPYSVVSYWEMLPYLLLGVLCAFAAIGFIRLLYKCEDIFNAFKVPEYLKPAAGGILIGIIGLYSHDLFGVGYGDTCWVSHMSVDQALVGEIGLVALFTMGALKIVATSLTIGSGGSGGVFAPSLFIGSMLGGGFGILVHHLFPAITATSGAYALVGMGAVFAGAAAAPITSIIMLFEMTRDYTLILPLMLAVVTSTFITQRLGRESIYTLKLMRRGVDIHRRGQADIMKTITVGEIMTRNFPTVSPKISIPELVEMLEETGHHGFPVVDEDGSFCGVVTLEDVEHAPTSDEPNLTVEDIAMKSPLTAYPDQTIYEVLARFGGWEVGRIPVVDRLDSKKLLGVLRRHDIIRAYTRTIKGRTGKNVL
jgi:CIC family chloride channel protein